MPFNVTCVLFETPRDLVGVNVDVNNTSIVNIWTLPKREPMPGSYPEPLLSGVSSTSLNESRNNTEISASKSSRLQVRLTDWSRTGGEWSLAASDGLLLSDEGTVWYDEKGIPTNIPGLGKGIHTWNVIMNGTGTQTIDATLTYSGRESTGPSQTYHYTIIIAP